MKEKIPYIPNGDWIYKVVCFILGKRKQKMSYQELYLLLKHLNEKALGEEVAAKKSMERILDIYRHFHKN